MAMQEVLARICNMYADNISKKNCSFHLFGRRNSDGWPMRTPESRGTLLWTKIQLEDMETHVYNLEHLLCGEMKSSDEAKELLHENQKGFIYWRTQY
jgi:hypothetical protein